MKINRFLMAVLLCLTMLFASACAPEAFFSIFGEADYPEAAEESWAIYIYFCGSDLESEYGLASKDLAEMMTVSLPHNIDVVLQTGGAANWKNKTVSADALERYHYGADGLVQIGSLPLASMGDGETFADFLSYAISHYPAEHRMLLLWDHGGGSVSGVVSDELFDNDTLTLPELKAALAECIVADTQDPLFDLVGLDACLMATLETAEVFEGFGSYFVASQELEPGTGWDYTALLETISADPGTDAAVLGRSICDAYYASCEETREEAEVTVSLTDLSRIGVLSASYENYARAALREAAEQPSFYAEMAESVSGCASYGGNTDMQGYTNMVDLGGLAALSPQAVSEEAEALSAALEDAVVYKRNGMQRESASGLSCYYSCSGLEADFYAYRELDTSDAMTYYFENELFGSLGEQGTAFVKEELGIHAPQTVPTFEMLNIDYTPLFLTDTGHFYTELDAAANSIVKKTSCWLVWHDTETDRNYFLGNDDLLLPSDEDGIYTENFDGKWGMLDGHLVYMHYAGQDATQRFYFVPVMRNGAESYVRVARNMEDGTWEILGVRAALDENGMGERSLQQLKSGDVIAPIFYETDFSGNGDVRDALQNAFVVTDNTSFAAQSLPDGEYFMFFEFTGIRFDSLTSDLAVLTAENGTYTLQ